MKKIKAKQNETTRVKQKYGHTILAIIERKSYAYAMCMQQENETGRHIQWELTHFDVYIRPIITDGLFIAKQFIMSIIMSSI